MKFAIFDDVKAQLNKEALKGYLTYLNILGIIIFVIGLLMISYAYISSFYFIFGFSSFDPSWIIRLAYLIIIACISGYILRKAIELLGDSLALSIIILVIGLAFLIFAFWTAQIFVEVEYQANPFTLVGLFFFGIMIAVGLFFFGKGMSDLIKIRNQKIPLRTDHPSENIFPPKTGNTEKGIPPDHPQAEFKICPKCLSQLSPDDTHCTVCGKKQE
jgi:cation transport ATPase